MAASGKTFDLFDPVPDLAQAPLEQAAAQRCSPKPLERSRSTRDRANRSRPTLAIAKPAEPLQRTTPARESLWLAITLPRSPLEALVRQTGELLPPSTRPAPAIDFPNLTREVQGGSRRGSLCDPAYSSRELMPHRPAFPAQSPTTISLDPRAPIVVVDIAHNQQCVVGCNAAAVRAGIGPGIGLNGAYALANDLQVLARDTAAEARWLETLAQWAGCFTPKVTIEAPDALLLEIKGSLKLFGGLESLRTLITKGLQAKGLQGALAIAPTPSAALAFSRTGQFFVCLQRAQLAAALADIPIETLRWPDEVLGTLQSMGVQKIGDCMRLPRDGLARRFGPQVLLQLDQLLGRAAQPQRSFVARERFSAKRDFETDIEGHESLSLHLQPIVQALEAFLRPRQSGVQSLELSFRHRGRPPTRLVLRFVQPTAEAAHIEAMLSAHLERLELPAAVIAARVRSGPLWPLEMTTITHRSLSDPQQAAPRTLTRLIERLRARLGHESVQGLRCVAEHRPELASQVSEPMVGAQKRVRAPASRAAALPRPFWLLPHPQRLEVQRSWPQFEGRLQLVQGPDRIESGWWDGNDVCRDYYMAATPQGLRVWIYRERKSKQWYLHGIYG